MQADPFAHTRSAHARHIQGRAHAKRGWKDMCRMHQRDAPTMLCTHVMIYDAHYFTPRHTPPLNLQQFTRLPPRRRARPLVVLLRVLHTFIASPFAPAP
eukprot:5789723-Pleurochrysis_carterae.AAC.1